MRSPSTKEKIQQLLDDVCALGKPFLWLRDTDSALPLAPALCEPLTKALNAIADFPDARVALESKLNDIYDRALDPQKPLVGIGAQPRSSRLGTRTAQMGLLGALAYARARREEFKMHAHDASCGNRGETPWRDLFTLANELIDNLDWGEFVIENARGQAASLVLETVELSNAIERSKSPHDIQSEIGDVFFNLIAFCLCMRIYPEHLTDLRASR